MSARREKEIANVRNSTNQILRSRKNCVHSKNSKKGSVNFLNRKENRYDKHPRTIYV